MVQSLANVCPLISGQSLANDSCKRQDGAGIIVHFFWLHASSSQTVGKPYGQPALGLKDLALQTLTMRLGMFRTWHGFVRPCYLENYLCAESPMAL